MVSGDGIVFLADADRLIMADGSLCSEGYVYSANEKTAKPYFESNEVKSTLDELHSLYEKELIYNPTGSIESNDDRIRSGDFDVIITYEGCDLPLINTPVTERKTTPYIYSRTACTTGISAGSDNKSEAQSLLELVNTDNEILKYLVLDDYKNKTSVNKNSELIIGSKAFSDKASLKKYYDESTVSSPFNGFVPDMKGKAAKTESISLESLWQSNDYNTMYQNMIEQLSGNESELNRINAQLKEFFDKEGQQ